MTDNSQSKGNDYRSHALLLSFSDCRLVLTKNSEWVSKQDKDSCNWHISADKPWWALVDIRDILNLFHPLVISETGRSAGACREVTISDDWKPPFALRFFCADDYFADAENHKPGQLGTESFFEHRFKQVLIDDKVVWERDVCDENTHGSETTFQMDITSYVEPGKPFRLTFRVLDKVSTLERNEHDVWFIGGVWYAQGDGKTEEPPRFHTAVWFADAVIGEQDSVAAFPPGRRPHEIAIEEHHHSRLPLSPRGRQMPSPARLKLVTPAVIPQYGFPITCGIPMPHGVLKDVNSLRLFDSTDNEMPVQSGTTGLWPDGSVRWLLLNAIAPSGAEDGAEFRLHFNEGVRYAHRRLRLTVSHKPDMPIKIEQNGQQVTVDTGAIHIRLGDNPETLIDAIFLTRKQQPAMINLKPHMSILLQDKPTPVSAKCQHIEVKEAGPVAICLEIHGSLDTTDGHVGRFLFRLYAYAGLPTIQTHFRIFNDVKPENYNGSIADAPLEVTELALIASIPEGISGKATAGVIGDNPIASDAGVLSILQKEVERFTAFTDDATPFDGRRAQGWIALTGKNGGIQASVWRFWQQYPKSLKVFGSLTNAKGLWDEKVLQIGLFTPSKEMPLYQPRFGEAKRHNLWFTFTDEQSSDETNHKTLRRW